MDQLAGEGNTGSASAGAGESFHPLATEARPVDAATASAQGRRFDEVHGDSYAATIDVRSSSGEPSPPYRIEIRDEMISRVTLQLEDGTEEDISDQLARHNVVSVGWIMDQIEGAAARSDATFTAVYDEQGVPRFVRFEDGTSPDLSAVEYLVTDVIRLPD